LITTLIAVAIDVSRVINIKDSRFQSD